MESERPLAIAREGPLFSICESASLHFASESAFSINFLNFGYGCAPLMK